MAPDRGRNREHAGSSLLQEPEQGDRLQTEIADLHDTAAASTDLQSLSGIRPRSEEADQVEEKTTFEESHELPLHGLAEDISLRASR